jgi:hypothetical protein
MRFLTAKPKSRPGVAGPTRGDARLPRPKDCRCDSQLGRTPPIAASQQRVTLVSAAEAKRRDVVILIAEDFGRRCLRQTGEQGTTGRPTRHGRQCGAGSE